ncbi:uncharacterized protein BO95DRAFT_512130 [Aspergillus brunneoviolaceus CBS 621.78]|uniref:Uncharacterized protein n=1 Tax=Aspergillus brunneoviolaceus CBS 621.78 TaxID=1450534 RepID=A0ACD1GH85_9EURO|nr:hypothetical protein BO95DRAFT_512130 [Aspergillus brunneoviolaceus CBS 621.78]RAH48628.1 hypothetical protein BO95DRAFT_512130 [Aspergillus brunneoviolaceus CBS 621.78]
MKDSHEMHRAASPSSPPPPPPSASSSSSSPPLRFTRTLNNKHSTATPTSPTTIPTTTTEQIYTMMTTASTPTPTPSHNHLPSHHPKRTSIHHHPITIPPRHRELSLTDSEISILDLGPSLLVLGEEGEGDGTPREMYSLVYDRYPDTLEEGTGSWEGGSSFTWEKADGEGMGSRMGRDTPILREGKGKGKARMDVADVADAAAAAEREWDGDGDAGLEAHAHPSSGSASSGGDAGGTGGCWSVVGVPLLQ